MAAEDNAVEDRLRRSRAALAMVSPDPFNAEAPPEALAGDITPTNLHYVRSNFALPAHDGVMVVGGAVANPMRLTLDDLRAMPAAEEAVTMECAGNGRLAQAPLPGGEPWGQYAVSAARWTGALLHQVLARARPADEAAEVLFEGADRGRCHHQDISFGRALPYPYAADPGSGILIAYGMNGEPLSADHGAPFRMIVPRYYGFASVKWLTRIAVLTEPYAGEFQTSAYMYEWPDRPAEPVTVMRPRARVTDPAPSAKIPAGPYTVRGKAWSGTGPVTKVEVSFAGDGDWQRARLFPPAGPYHWQEWSCDWQATRVARHTIRARATDVAGNTQPDVPVWNRLGYGNNAVEVICVDVC